MTEERHTVTGCGTVGMEMEGRFLFNWTCGIGITMEQGYMLKMGCKIVVGGIHLQSRKMKQARCPNGIVLRGGTRFLRF